VALRQKITSNAEASALLEKMIAEKDAEEAAEAVPVLSAKEIANERAFLAGWTRKGKLLINRAGGNFWMAGSNRARCSIYRPARLKSLVNAGVLKPQGSSYVFLYEAPKK